MARFMVLVKLLLTISLSFVGFSAQAAKMKGAVKVDGSSTVFPITEAIAEEYRSEQPRVRVTIGVSGTGGGFKKFIAGETDINDASRAIKGSEKKMAAEKGVGYLELPVAYDGITVVVNKANTWATTMTAAELKKIWQPNSKVTKWSDVRPEWPKEKIELFGPGTDSGTFDYFTKAINGKERASRSNYTMSEKDHVLVKGVSGNKYALGYFGYAYYAENSRVLKSVAIDGGKGAVKPTLKTINDGSYTPLSRPVFIYVSKKAAAKPQVKSFVDFYLRTAGDIVTEVGYVPLTKKEYKEAQAKFDKFAL